MQVLGTLSDGSFFGETAILKTHNGETQNSADSTQSAAGLLVKFAMPSTKS